MGQIPVKESGPQKKGFLRVYSCPCTYSDLACVRQLPGHPQNGR
jgi:hypothetical protein